jgi:hypothetical protein
MMRPLLGLALTIAATTCCGGSAGADDFWSDYQTAMSVFRTGEGDALSYSERAFETILDGIDGRWTPITALNLKAGDEAGLQEACRIITFDAMRLSQFSFRFTRRAGKDPAQALEYKYTLVTGNIFGFSADDGAVLKLLALGGPDKDLKLKLSVLRAANGLAELYRQGPALLVVKSILGPPEIYARCRQL